MPADLLTLAQAARVLKLSRRRVRDFVREGRLPAEVYGHYWLIRIADVRAFAARKRRPGNPAWVKSASRV